MTKFTEKCYESIDIFISLKVLFFSFDEVQIFFDLSQSRTCDIQGKNEITVKTTKDYK